MKYALLKINFEPTSPSNFALVSLEQMYELGGNL
jgi:hypothetical protein